MRIEAVSNFGEYLVPIIVPLSVIAYTAEVGMTVFLSFERYIGGFHLNIHFLVHLTFHNSFPTIVMLILVLEVTEMFNQKKT